MSTRRHHELPGGEGRKRQTVGVMPLVLVVEDDPSMRAYLRGVLADEGFRVVDADTGARALAQAASNPPDLVLLDLILPDVHGAQVTARLRETTEAPILILSAIHQENEKITALDSGANDYLTKPFSTGELLARVRVWLRQFVGENPRASVIEVGDLRIDFDSRLAFVDEVEVHLTPTQYKLLGTLMRNAGKLLTYEQLLFVVWGPEYAKQTHYLHVYMGQLRHKIERDPARPRYLVTEPGIGYRLRID